MEDGVVGTEDGDAIAFCGRERADTIPPPNRKPSEMASLLLTGSLAPWLHPETAVIETSARLMILHMFALALESQLQALAVAAIR